MEINCGPVPYSTLNTCLSYQALQAYANEAAHEKRTKTCA